MYFSWLLWKQICTRLNTLMLTWTHTATDTRTMIRVLTCLAGSSWQLRASENTRQRRRHVHSDVHTIGCRLLHDRSQVWGPERALGAVQSDHQPDWWCKQSHFSRYAIHNSPFDLPTTFHCTFNVYSHILGTRPCLKVWYHKVGQGVVRMAARKGSTHLKQSIYIGDCVARQ